MQSKGYLIVVCGWSMSGKSTTARALSQRLNIHWIDIEESMRIPIFGVSSLDRESSAFKDWDQKSMAGSYALLFHAIDLRLDLKDSFVVSANFSHSKNWDLLTALLKKNPNFQLRVIRCFPRNDGVEELEKRIKKRIAAGGHPGVCSIPLYESVKARFAPIPFPHLSLDTSPPNSLDNCVTAALTYLRNGYMPSF